MKIFNYVATGALSIAAAVFTLPAAAQQPAVTSSFNTTVRAGPDGVYPVVAVLPPRAEVTVFGCLEGYSWCDVGFGIDRGWITSSSLRYYYQNRYVPLAGVATVVGIGFAYFAFDDYWRNNYRGRPWYGERDRWHRGPEPRYWVRPQDRGNFAPNRNDWRGNDNRGDNRGDWRGNDNRNDNRGDNRGDHRGDNRPGFVQGNNNGGNRPQRDPREGRPQPQQQPQSQQQQQQPQGRYNDTSNSGWTPPTGAVRPQAQQQQPQPRAVMQAPQAAPQAQPQRAQPQQHAQPQGRPDGGHENRGGGDRGNDRERGKKE